MADEIVAVYRAEVEQYKKAVDELTAKVDELTAAEKKAGDTGKDAMKGVAGVASSVSPEVAKVTGAFSALTMGLGKVSAAFRTLKGAFIATGIGAFVVTVVSLVQAFRASEEGQNKFQKILAKTGVVVNNILDLFAELGEKIIEAFEKPEQAWEDFKESLRAGAEFVKRQVVDRLAATFTLMGNDILSKFIEMRVAWNEFTNDADEANALRAKLGEIADSSARARDEINGLNAEIADGYRRAKAALGEFMDENEREMALAAKVADMRAKANKIERSLIVERAKLESEIAELRLKARQDEEYAASERIEFMKEAQRLQDVLLEKETEMLSLRRDAIQLENTFARSNKEALDAEAQAVAAVSQMEATRYTQKRATERELARITRQRIAEEIEQEKMLAQIKQGLLDISKEIDEQLSTSSEDVMRREIQLAEESAAARVRILDAALRENVVSLLEYKDRSVEIEVSRQQAIEDAERAHQERLEEIRRAAEEAERIRRQQNLEQQVNDFLQYTQVVADIYNTLSMAIMAGYDNELTALQNSLEAGEISQEQFDQKRRELARRRASDEKAAALFGAILSTAQAVASALAVGPPQGFVLAAIAGALGAVQIGTIAAQPLPAFAKGVIGLQGAGTETSDSIPAMLSRGESVMTAAETRKHRDILEGIRKGSLDRIIHEQYVRPAVDAALLNGFADMGKSAALNGIGGFNDMNILRALDRHGFAEVGELREMNVLLKRHLKAPKRGYA